MMSCVRANKVLFFSEQGQDALQNFMWGTKLVITYFLNMEMTVILEDLGGIYFLMKTTFVKSHLN